MIWYYLGTVAIVSLIGIPLVIGAIRRAGRDAERALSDEQTIATGKKIADAESIAPADRAQLVDRLRRGGGL
jgi:hypothetical protein